MPHPQTHEIQFHPSFRLRRLQPVDVCNSIYRRRPIPTLHGIAP
jgi:hypothetical protein